MTELTPAILKELNLPPTQGLYVRSVAAGGQAFSVGLRSGDVILQIQEENIDNIYTYNKMIDSAMKNRIIKLKVLRNGQFNVFLAGPIDRNN